jgi:predicted Zn-dependent protease
MLSLVSEDQEIAMGQESAPEIEASMGRVPDEALQAYVSDLGERMAAISERPDLPWSFVVLDDPLINAFALPGGFIFVTRGILVYMESEAELAGVLGHEIGHVTARHSVEQISRQQLMGLGLGIGSVVSPTVRANAQLLGQSLQLMTLKFGRDDEMQSDDLGLRYMTRLGYDPQDHASVFAMLGEVSGGGEGAVPEWLSTHPNPENREGRILDQIAAREAAGEDFSGATRGVDPFLDRLDGLVVGENPREGFFDGALFHHPDLEFRLTFPEGWTTLNTRQAVAAVSPAEDAVLVLTLADEDDPRLALSAFLATDGIQAGTPEHEPVNGLAASSARFRIAQTDGSLDGAVTFIRHGNLVYRFLGYTSTALWEERGPTIQAAFVSFRPETDPAVLRVEPRRLEVVRVPEGMTIAEFADRYPSTVPAEQVALLNRRALSESVPAGTRLKRVVGGPGPQQTSTPSESVP